MANLTELLNNQGPQINPAPADKPKSKAWMIAPIAGGAALVFGGLGVGAYTLINKDEHVVVNEDDNNDDDVDVVDEVEIDGETEEELVETEVVSDGEMFGNGTELATSGYVTFDPTHVHQAHSVDDDMTFAQAFQAAREEVGPGGVFVWHGNIYGTYHVDEWNAMSHEDQLAFSSSFHYSAPTHLHDHNHMAYHHEDPVVYDPNEVAIEIEEEDEGLMLISQEYNAENDMHLAYVTDGHDVAMFADVDNDGTYDFYVADLDGNGEITDNEIIDISDQGLSINDVAELPQYDAPDPYDDVMA